ncbi:RNA-binding domain-containing protein [Aliarcobacter skirrowii]|uniref:RNA-binding domain-containing protein n=1 Tax=Aliarcobacter skirrowii TaxID=28200 RepID=UPI000826E700|nr:RNA-binding domain-containing protein [Aliarcobacter skirrowii]
MTKQELQNRLQDIEWEDFEVKLAIGGVPKSVWESVSAFSNTSGGWLIFEIEEKNGIFNIVGVSNPSKIEHEFLNSLNGEKFNIKIRVKSYKYNFDNKIVLAFYIPISKQKPVYFNSLSNSFIRSGSADRRATKEEIDTMFRDQSFGTKTSETIENYSIENLSSISLKQYKEYLQISNPTSNYNKLNMEEFLHKVLVLIDGKPTYAGLLFFGTRDSIQRYFVDFRIDLFEIPGNSISDAKTRYTYRLPEQENLWDYYFILFERITMRIDKPFKLDNMGFAKENYPYIDALREALVNMLMHADYFSPIKSRIRVFSDKIEFFNAGSYPKPIEYFLNSDTSIPRNPILAKLFRVVKLAENAGYGFDKMIDGWKTYTDIPIDFKTDMDTSLTTFYLEKKEAQVEAQVDLNDTEKKVLEFLNFENLSSAQLVQKLGLKSLSGSLKNAIRHLLEIKLIELTIPDRPKSPNQKYKTKQDNIKKETK